MNIILTTIDHHRADIAQREVFACSEDQVKEVYRQAKATRGVFGAVLLNTCNRTELYLSLDDPAEDSGAAADSPRDPYLMLCRVLELDPEEYRELQRTLREDDVLRHLCLLTAGAESQLWGDSQIITQVGEAIERAREEGCADSLLNTMFRLGITAGKEIRTHVDLYIHDASTAKKAVDVMLGRGDAVGENAVPGENAIGTVLVIGNGAIGRMVADELVRAGRKTFMTLRKYRYSQSVVPEGVSPVPFEERYAVMERCDGVISATASPHVVVTRKAVEQVTDRPRLFIDMAVPRDVEPEVGDLEGVSCWNIDDVSRGHHRELKRQQKEQLEDYIEDQVEEFHRWEHSRDKVEKTISRLTDPGRDRGERRHFPLYIDTMDRPVVVIGGGNIAERRIMTLAEFAFRITVISEDLSETLKRMVEGGAITWVKQDYVPTVDTDSTAEDASQDAERKESLQESLLKDAWLVLACTNDRVVNRGIGELCREKGIFVNICDARHESTFWFPAVALSDELTMGLVGRGTDHMNVKKAAAVLRRVVERKEYKKDEDQSRKQRKPPGGDPVGDGH